MNAARTLLAPISLALLFAACSGGGGGSGSAPADTLSMSATLAAGQVRLTYYGHSMFTIQSPGGVTVLTDPNEGIGYRAPAGKIDVITVSHEHFDHNKTEVAKGARVLRGLKDGDWATIDETIGDVRIRSVPGAFHDDRQGAERGKNAVFVFDVVGLRIVHAGDLGHTGIPFDNVPSLGADFRPDVLLLPVGGHFTIGPEQANQVLKEVRPEVAVPMHYRTPALHNFPDADKLAPVDDFIANRSDVRRAGGSEVILQAGALPSGVLVLEPQPE